MVGKQSRLAEGINSLFKLPRQKSGLKKLDYRLIVMFLSTEIFSKRRKIYAWLKRNQSCLPSHQMSHINKTCERIMWRDYGICLYKKD